MKIQQVISELLEIEAYSDLLREKANRIRKSLEYINKPASPGKNKRGLSETEKREFVSKFQRAIYKKANK